MDELGRNRPLVRLLNEGTKLNEDGAIVFEAPDFHDLFFLLADGITYPDGLDRTDVSGITYETFIKLRKFGTVKKEAFLRHTAQSLEKLRSSPTSCYTMWSKMRLRQMAFAKSVKLKIDGVKVRTAAKLPCWLRVEEHFVSGVGRVEPNVLPFFGYIIFSVNARTENEAASRIFSACDQLYAVVNTAWRSTELWIQRRPTANVWLGPNQFFFRNRRYLGEDHVWYSLNFNEETWNQFAPNAADFVKRSPKFRDILKRLASHPLKGPLTQALVLISEGMTSQDLAFRLMRFWSALEVLYSEGQERTSVKKLIARAVFASQEQTWIDRLELLRLYDLRNSFVHSGSRESNDTSLVQHLRELLLRQIYYYIRNGSDIRTHRELLMVVDLPADEEALSRQSSN